MPLLYLRFKNFATKTFSQTVWLHKKSIILLYQLCDTRKTLIKLNLESFFESNTTTTCAVPWLFEPTCLVNVRKIANTLYCREKVAWLLYQFLSNNLFSIYYKGTLKSNAKKNRWLTICVCICTWTKILAFNWTHFPI